METLNSWLKVLWCQKHCDIWGKNFHILREYYNSPWEDDEEAQKWAILQTAAKLLKTDIKSSCTSGGYLSNNGQTETSDSIRLHSCEFAVLVASSVCWEGSIHIGCWHRTSCCSSSASKSCYCTLTAGSLSANAPLAQVTILDRYSFNHGICFILPRGTKIWSERGMFPCSRSVKRWHGYSWLVPVICWRQRGP